jgi:exodeoxyribonuclease I
MSDALPIPEPQSHYEMMRQIAIKCAAWSPAVFLGFDSLAVGERFLRQAFYMTLHNPYLTNSDANGRSDVLRMIEAASVHAPGAVRIPRKPDKSADISLIAVARANGFEASDGSSESEDIEATIFLCRLLLDRAPDHVSACTRFSQKASVVAFIEEEPIILFTERLHGKSFTWHVTSLGNDDEKSWPTIVFNLAVDPDGLSGLPDEQLKARLLESPKPLRRVRANSCPILLNFDESLPTQGVGVEEMKRRATSLETNKDLRARLVKASTSESRAVDPSPFVEMQLRDGFISRDDLALMQRFHELPWSERLDVLEEITDARLKVIGQLLILTELPDIFDVEQRATLANQRLRARSQ